MAKKSKVPETTVVLPSGMIEVTKGPVTITEARDQKFDAISYSWKFERFPNTAMMIAAGAQLSQEKQLKVVNAMRDNNARNKASNAALDAAKIFPPNAENDPQFRLRQMFDTLMTSKLYTEEEARAIASTTLKTEWEDDDED